MDMRAPDLSKTNTRPADAKAPSVSSSMSLRSAFQRWLADGNARKCSPEAIVSCMDRAFEYALHNKIATGNLWKEANHWTFGPVYHRLVESRQLRITDPKTHRSFVRAGRLYLQFLKGTKAAFRQTDSIAVKEGVRAPGDAYRLPTDSAVDPQCVISWLVTQPNANGTPYLERVAREYVGVLRTAPAKLKIPSLVDPRSVFSCHTAEELTTYWDLLKGAPNYKQVNRATSGMLSAGLGCYMRYLQHLHGAAQTEGRVAKATERQKTKLTQATTASPPIPPRVVDFNHAELYAQTRPLTCTINGQMVVPSRENWPQLLVAITEQLIANDSPNLNSLNRNPLYGSKAFFMPRKAVHGNCAQLSNGSWIYTGYNPQIIVTIIRNLCYRCEVALEDVVIAVEPRSGGPVGMTRARWRRTSASDASPSTLDPAVVEQLTNILSTHFSNGYRLSSPIELARFKSFFAEDLGEEVKVSDEDLPSHIAACGTVYEGKVYIVSSKAKERIKELAEEYFGKGAQAIFYEEFYAKNETWLYEARVVSQDMLTGILRGLFPRLSFTRTYFGHTDAAVAATLESEILRVWSHDTLVTYDQLAERLRYVPLERIKYALAQNCDFIWSRVGAFSHVSRVDVTDGEREAIRQAAMRECSACGYATLAKLPLGDIEERNHELSVTAVRDAVYRLCLSDSFDKKGKIVTRKGDAIDPLTIMKDHCQTVDRCSLDDLLNFEKELTGEVHRWIPMEAANVVLVRIDKNAYVAERHVHFDSHLIDGTINRFVQGDYLPLKSFTTFGMFPDCGQVWNLFLLESYCRRFSREFRFDAPSVNSRNAGAVIRRSCTLDYTGILTDAVANAAIPLKSSTVSRFLFASGYTGRSTHAGVIEIINGAKAKRERMG